MKICPEITETQETNIAEDKLGVKKGGGGRGEGRGDREKMERRECPKLKK